MGKNAAVIKDGTLKRLHVCVRCSDKFNPAKFVRFDSYEGALAAGWQWQDSTWPQASEQVLVCPNCKEE